jgi:hypothetical protein
MAIQRRHQRPGDLEFDAAAQAAAVDGGHGVLRRSQQRGDGRGRTRRLRRTPWRQSREGRAQIGSPCVEMNKIAESLTLQITRKIAIASGLAPPIQLAGLALNYCS